MQNDTSLEVKDIMHNAIQKAHHTIADRAAQDKNLQGMANTINIVYHKNNITHIAQVGDSRVYLFEKRNFKQITKDQNIKNFMRKE